MDNNDGQSVEVEDDNQPHRTISQNVQSTQEILEDRLSSVKKRSADDPASPRTSKRRRPGRLGSRGEQRPSWQLPDQNHSSEELAAERHSSERKFACHYFKKDPRKYIKCAFRSQNATRYVRVHLMRMHMQPLHCHRCFATFGHPSELKVHDDEAACEPQDKNPFEEEISEDQRRTLLKRRPAGEDSEAAWFAMWDVLFPGVPHPQSPYEDLSGLTWIDPDEPRLPIAETTSKKETKGGKSSHVDNLGLP